MRHPGLVLSASLAAGIAVTSLSSSPSPLAGQDLPSPARAIDITITEGTNFMATASPDRQWIAIDLLGALWVLPIGGGDARRVTPDTLEARNPAWSPDSRSLTFQAYDDNNWHIHTVNADGSNLRVVTSGAFDDQDPEWSPDGQRIVFSSDRFGGILTIWQTPVAPGGPVQLSQMPGRDPCWVVSAVSDRDVIFLGPPPPGSPPGSPPAWWVVGPGGREILLDLYVPPERRTQGVVACASGRTVTIPPEPRRAAAASDTDTDVFPFRPQWTSAAELLYTADGHIKQRRLNGPGIVIPFTARLTIRRPAYARRHRALHPDAPQNALGIVSPSVAPDGSRIAFIALGDLWVLRIGQQPLRVTNDANVELDPAWSPDGSRLAFSTDRSGQMELWVHDFASGRDTQLTHENRRVRGAAWSPDGREIAFQSDRVREPMTLTLDPGGGLGTVRRVGAGNGTVPGCGEPGSDGRPTWTSTGGALAVGVLVCYTAREGTNQLRVHSDTASPTTAVLLVHHSAGNRKNGGPVWSPDGARVAYVSEGRLWSQGVDANGNPLGEATPIADGTPSFPSWEGDSRHVVYLAPDGLQRVSAEGGSPDAIDLGLPWLALRPPERVVVHAGTLFDGRSSNLLRSVDIVVERGRIREITPHDNDLHVGQVIDASNETVMPGLIDSDAHIDPAYGEAAGRIWLSYGVTTVRDATAEAYAGLEMRESYDAGRRLGPRLFIAGDPFAGIRVFEAGGTSIGSLAQLEADLARASRLNVDFFSTRVRLADRHQQRIAAFAHEHGLGVLSPQLWPSVASGVDALAPLRERARRGQSARVSAAGNTYRDVVDVIAKSGMTFTPVLGGEGALLLATARDRRILDDDPRLALFPADIVESLQAAADALRRTPVSVTRLEQSLIPLGRTVHAIASAGGTILAGSGASETLPYGLTLHIELEQYVKAGLSPFQALQTATTNAAEALGIEEEIGTIEPGKLADLTIVAGNPLMDIRATRNVTGVMRGGWYYDLPALGIPR